MPSFLPDRHKLLFHAQSEIGWNQLWQGRWSIQWVHLHDEMKKLNNWRTNGEQYMTHAIKMMWTHMHQIWIQRNQHQHGIDTSSQDLQARRRLSPQVQAIYNKASTLDAQDRTHFETPIATILELPARQLETWVFKHHKFLKEAIKRAKQRAAQSQPSIADFFEPTHQIISIPVLAQSRRSTPIPMPTTQPKPEPPHSKRTLLKRRIPQLVTSIKKFFQVKPRLPNPKSDPGSYQPP